MSAEQLVVLLIIGGVAGWLAGLILKTGGFGIIGNVIIGVIGAFLGGWLFGIGGAHATSDDRGRTAIVAEGDAAVDQLCGDGGKLHVNWC